MGPSVAVAAHPMPNTVIAVSLDDHGATFDIEVPVPELRLAIPGGLPTDIDPLVEPHRSAIAAYFGEHVRVTSAGGERQPFTLQSLTVWEANDGDVGLYQEVRLRLFVAATGAFNPRDFTLAYDAVIHQVGNHVALVQIARDFRAGLLDRDRAFDVGVIRFDFARNVTPPLSISAAPGSLWRGLRASVALGFQHVATGIDHVLFVITLLVVAPLAVVGRRWSLFQGWSYTFRRFVAISLSFTIGHSIALIAGTYRLVPLPLRFIEVLIAVSILVAAVHAIRPVFTGREWAVAAGFGLVHGLAFAETLAESTLAPSARALAVLGFNVGVEGAQLVAMALAVPLLLASRWPVFHVVRLVTMSGAAIVAAYWLLQRV